MRLRALRAVRGGEAQVCPEQYQPGFTGPGSFAEQVMVPAADTNTTGKAWARVGGQDAGLSRWDESGRRDDSPIIPRERALFRAYRYKIADRQAASPRAMRLRRTR